jgi:hypothetical protein
LDLVGCLVLSVRIYEGCFLSLINFKSRRSKGTRKYNLKNCVYIEAGVLPQRKAIRLGVFRNEENTPPLYMRAISAKAECPSLPQSASDKT